MTSVHKTQNIYKIYKNMIFTYLNHLQHIQDIF